MCSRDEFDVCPKPSAGKNGSSPVMTNVANDDTVVLREVLPHDVPELGWEPVLRWVRAQTNYERSTNGIGDRVNNWSKRVRAMRKYKIK